MPFLLHELLLTLWKKLPQAFWEAQARFIPVSVLCHGRWALSAVNNLQMEGGRGKAGQHLRQSWFFRSKIKCLQGLTQVFSDEATLSSPLKDIQSPTIYESVLKNIYKEKWNDVVSQNDEKVAVNLWDVYHLFNECHCHTKGFCKSVLSVFKFAICLIELYC